MRNSYFPTFQAWNGLAVGAHGHKRRIGGHSNVASIYSCFVIIQKIGYLLELPQYVNTDYHINNNIIKK